ncbi:ATP-grasp domain-containing protein [Kordiimonas marina]|uniref:ATP-grasp domain-containing protein n=1 Tax=Kordiimonas marina TaxID=2872312 RepID=UPI001FF5173B|nr:ATP-grasp domain-containing protein [Kordiimonas marina]MCJ9430327.1 ATP-grasp domain-containing protein [Kordiimonas marina]
MKTLLIIGAGMEQAEAYKLAKSKGLTVVGTDMDPEAPAFEFADVRLIASTRDVDETCAVVGAFAKTHKIDGVMTIANDVPYTVAKVAEMLGVPGAPSEAVARLTNKAEMKRAFQAAGVATPAFCEIRTLAELEAEAGKRSFPMILKPSDGRGAKGVLYLEAEMDLAWAFDHAMSACGSGLLLLEAYYGGPQLSVEGMFIGGRYHAVAFADRNYSNLPLTKPYIVEDGGTLPSRFGGDMQEKIRAVIEAGAKAMGLHWGVVKADIVLDDAGEPAIIELAGRLSGNYLATHHIPFAYGVDLVGAVMDLCLGDEVAPERLVPKRMAYLGVRYFFPPAGRVVAVSGGDEVAALPYVHELMIYRKAGDMQPRIESHGARAGTVMAEGASYEEATERAEACAAMIKFVVETQK